MLNSNTSTHRGSAESSTMKHELFLSEYDYANYLVAMGKLRKCSSYKNMGLNFT